MTLRDQRQKEFAREWIEKGEHGILHLCPRFGKIRVTLNILKAYDKNCRLLISYPDSKIKQSWLDDFAIVGYDNSNVTFTTHLSLKKYKDMKFDLVVIDECHLLSEAQIDVCKELFSKNKRILGLSGTLSRETRNVLEDELGLFVSCEYPLEKAIEEGVIVDYEITVVKAPLDNLTKQ